MFGWMVARLFESLKYRMICCDWDGGGGSVEIQVEERHRLPPQHDAGGVLWV
jgi:hypothetical protein